MLHVELRRDGFDRLPELVSNRYLVCLTLISGVGDEVRARRHMPCDLKDRPGAPVDDTGSLLKRCRRDRHPHRGNGGIGGRSRKQETDCRQHTTVGRDHDASHAERSGQRRCVKTASSTECVQERTPWVGSLLDRDPPDRTSHRLICDREDPECGANGCHPEPVCELPDGHPGGIDVDGELTPERSRRVQATEHGVGIRNRGLVSASPVAGGSRIRSCALRADTEGPAGVDPGNGSASGANRVDAYGRESTRITVYGPLIRDIEPAVGDPAHVRGRSPHVERHHLPMAMDGRKLSCRYHATCWAREENRCRMRCGMCH